MQIERWISFRGRTSREGFLCVLGTALLIVWSVDLLAQALGFPNPPDARHWAGETIVFRSGMSKPATLVNIAFLPLLFSFAIRRLHDSGASGWWILIAFFTVAFANFVPPENLDPWVRVPSSFGLAVGNWLFSSRAILLYLLVRPGTIGDNRYGPDPIDGERRSLAGSRVL